MTSIYPIYEEHDGYWVGWYPRAPGERYEGKTREDVVKQLPIVRVRAGVVVSQGPDGAWHGHIAEIEAVAVTGPSEAAVRKRVYASLMERMREDAEIAATFERLRDDPPDSWEVELIPRRNFRQRLAEEMRNGQPMTVEEGIVTREGWVSTNGRWGADSDIVRSAEAFLKAATSPPEPGAS